MVAIVHLFTLLFYIFMRTQAANFSRLSFYKKLSAIIVLVKQVKGNRKKAGAVLVFSTPLRAGVLAGAEDGSRMADHKAS